MHLQWKEESVFMRLSIRCGIPGRQLYSAHLMAPVWIFSFIRVSACISSSGLLILRPAAVRLPFVWLLPYRLGFNHGCSTNSSGIGRSSGPTFIMHGPENGCKVLPRVLVQARKKCFRFERWTVHWFDIFNPSAVIEHTLDSFDITIV
jgi:hypothetical protein